MMDIKEKLEREITRKRKLIEDSENILEQVPDYLKPRQEFALEIYRKQLEVLEEELNKIERSNPTNRLI